MNYRYYIHNLQTIEYEHHGGGFGKVMSFMSVRRHEK